MKNTIIFIYLALLVGCAPRLQIRSYLANDYQMHNNKTYYWSPAQEPVKPGNPLLDNKENRQLIKQAIDKEMKRKGYMLDSINPSLWIEYFVKLENKRSVITAPLPYTDDFDMEYRVKVEELKKGSLVIHLENGAHTKTIWIGSAEATIEAVPTDTKFKINSTVKKIMVGLPALDQPALVDPLQSY